MLLLQILSFLKPGSKAKVDELQTFVNVVLLNEDQVLWLDVSVNDALLVEVI